MQDAKLRLLFWSFPFKYLLSNYFTFILTIYFEFLTSNHEKIRAADFDELSYQSLAGIIIVFLLTIFLFALILIALIRFFKITSRSSLSSFIEGFNMTK
jgi:hypothetical protein